MKLKDIKPGMVVWNQWEYSIMGRDTGTNSKYYYIVSVGKIFKPEPDSEKHSSVVCEVKDIYSDIINKQTFGQDEIDRRNLRVVGKLEIQKLKIEAKRNIESEILEHKTKLDILELELININDKFQELLKNITE